MAAPLFCSNNADVDIDIADIGNADIHDMALGWSNATLQYQNFNSAHASLHTYNLSLLV